MRDLSRFADNSFDLVWQPYSINFVPDAPQVIAEVGRVLHPGGFYNLDFRTPASSSARSALSRLCAIAAKAKSGFSHLAPRAR